MRASLGSRDHETVSACVSQPGDEAAATVQDRPGEGVGDGQGRREGETGAGAGFEVKFTECQVAFRPFVLILF